MALGTGSQDSFKKLKQEIKQTRSDVKGLWNLMTRMEGMLVEIALKLLQAGMSPNEDVNSTAADKKGDLSSNGNRKRAPENTNGGEHSQS